MTDIQRMDPYQRRALKGWARRRLNRYLKDFRHYMGRMPKQVTLWAEDYDLLKGQDDRIELKRGRERL